ncbi:MAG: hypothetical protein KJN76_05865 [Eudoraea sp.]|nr:hypothetical protein [Eudoraea sp.]
MKLGQNLFKKDQSIWGKPIIEYDQTKMNELFSEIRETGSNSEKSILPGVQSNEISLETELYLMIHS